MIFSQRRSNFLNRPVFQAFRIAYSIDTSGGVPMSHSYCLMFVRYRITSHRHICGIWIPHFGATPQARSSAIRSLLNCYCAGFLSSAKCADTNTERGRMSESTATITINLTLEEADFICGALVEYRYENYARKALDKTMIYPDFLKLYCACGSESYR